VDSASKFVSVCSAANFRTDRSSTATPVRLEMTLSWSATSIPLLTNRAKAATESPTPIAANAGPSLCTAERRESIVVLSEPRPRRADWNAAAV
jgi:hypothetical protein